MRDLADLFHRLNHADFVIGVHERDQDGLVRDRFAQHVQIHYAVGFHGQIRDAVPVLLEFLAGVEHRFVLGRRRDDVVAFFGVHLGHALDRQVVGFGGAAGENNFLGGRADQIRDLLARVVDCLFRFPPETVVAAGGVAEFLREVWQHGVDDSRVSRRRSVIIKINWRLHELPS